MLNVNVVCGLPRSGTTYLGKVLSLASDNIVFHEPFNFKFGLLGIPLWFPYMDKGSSYPEVEAIISNAVNVNGKWLKPTLVGKKRLKNARYKLIGGQQHMSWRMLKLRKMLGILPSQVIWKDPFCTFMVDFLTRVREMPVICLIRHPCAQYYSVKKQNWLFDIRNLVSQEELITSFGKDISPELWKMAEVDNLISNALLWKMMARVITHSAIDNDRLMVVRHEDLCETPETVLDTSCRHFGLQLTPKMRAYIRNTTEGNSPDGESKQVHSFVRDSKALVRVWKDRLSLVEQEQILSIVGDDLNVFFSS